MGIWIRSQNREQLTYANDIYTRLITNHKYQLTTGRGIILGEYSTKEKALKVLDMIQNEILDVKVALEPCVSSVKVLGNVIPPKVFQMPQDDEV